MRNISIRSTLVLSILGILSIVLMYIVENTKKEYTQPYFEEKLDAARIMDESLSYLKEKHFKDEISIDNINDPNDTKIIGTRYSSITSGRGSLPIKLSTANPNFAALLVELFKDAKLKKGDHIAIGATGSFPALNIAACAAAEALELKVSYIASVSSSSWGANNPDYTFLDIHKSLEEGKYISHSIIASSIGANEDLGRTLSTEGREQCIAAIERNGVQLINGKTFEENIATRMKIFAQRENKLGKIQLYINIGGGIASLGGVENSATFPSGLSKDVKLNLFKEKEGIMFEFASLKTPLINLKNIEGLMNRYDLPKEPTPLPKPGKGKLFYDLQYDMRIVLGTTLFLVMLIFLIIVFDKKQNALGNEIIQQETEEK